MIMIMIIAIIIIMIMRSASKASYHYLSQGTEQSHWPLTTTSEYHIRSQFLSCFCNLIVIFFSFFPFNHIYGGGQAQTHISVLPQEHCNGCNARWESSIYELKLSHLLGFQPKTFSYPRRHAYQYAKSSCWFLICQTTTWFLSLITSFTHLVSFHHILSWALSVIAEQSKNYLRGVIWKSKGSWGKKIKWQIKVWLQQSIWGRLDLLGLVGT